MYHISQPGGFYGSRLGNDGAYVGGVPLKNLFPNAPSDIPFAPGTPGIVRPGTNQKLKDLFPYQPGGYGGEEGGPRYGTTPGGVALGPANPSFTVGNMAGMANAQFFGGPQMAQATAPGQPLGKPQIGGGAPNIPLTLEERERLLQPGSPAPPDLRERFGIPKAEMPYGFQNKYVS